MTPETTAPATKPAAPAAAETTAPAAAPAEPDALRRLARACGVQTEYVNTSGAVQAATDESLIAVLRALGVALADPGEAEPALLGRQLQAWRRAVEPVLVAWDGGPTPAELRLPADHPAAEVACRLVADETGEAREWTARVAELEVVGSTELGGERFVARHLPIPLELATGYHRLSVALDGAPAAEALVISAPRRAYEGSAAHGTEAAAGGRLWGLFCPLHALHGGASWGAGDLGDLEALMDYTAGLGGNVVATLPLLATAFDGPTPHISPYSPTSRLFWNEFYLDLRRIPDLKRSNAARGLLEADETLAEVAGLRSRDLVHYGQQMRLKRRVLEYLADAFFDADPDGSEEFRRYVAEHPDVEAFAYFQAMGERFGRDWRRWPEGADPDEIPARVDQRAVQYHLYAQFQAHAQLAALAERSRAQGMTWYLDFPIGVDFNSFDVWRAQAEFATGASVGCPPDLVFTKGQNWGFPPLHPDRQRESGYRYLIASFRNQLRYAGALRVDHVMGLHRLFWIPDGAEAKHGAYVSTPAEEIYAILSVESHRRRAWLVGEDLGTVPPEVESALNRHAVAGMYVIQYELKPDPALPLRPVPASTVASVNTHDMPPFGSYWQGLDLDDRHALGLLDDDGLLAERQARAAQKAALVDFLRREGRIPADATVDDAAAALAGVWGWLATSPARVLLLNVEDLWLETEAQNTPNTSFERPNWQRKLRHPLEAIATNDDFRNLLAEVDRLRQQPVAPKADPDQVDVEAVAATPRPG